MGKLAEDRAKLARDVVAKLLEEFCDRPLKDGEEIAAFEVKVVVEGKDYFVRSGFNVGPFEILEAKLDYEDKFSRFIDKRVEEVTPNCPENLRAFMKEKIKKCLFD